MARELPDEMAERKNPKVDKNATPRWCNCRFCGEEFYDTGTFLTEVYHWLQSICDNCKRRHQAEVRYEVAMGTPGLSHLVDEHAVAIRGFYQDEDISIDPVPWQFQDEDNPLRITVKSEESVFSFVMGRPEVADLAAVLNTWLETGKLVQPTLPKEEEG